MINPFVKSLRRHATDAERLLWFHLRDRRFFNYKFRRQVPIGSYVVDFLCVEKRLVIELDGGQHAERVEYDEKRTAYLQGHKLQVVRFWNNDVLKNVNGVLLVIKGCLEGGRGFTL